MFCSHDWVFCSHDWEHEFMSVHGRAYVEEANKEDHKKIGCYRAQITMCKIVQVKKININFVWKIHTSVSKE